MLCYITFWLMCYFYTSYTRCPGIWQWRHAMVEREGHILSRTEHNGRIRIQHSLTPQMVKHNYSKVIQNWQVAIPHCYWEGSCLFGHMWHQLLSWTCWYVSLIVGKARGWGLDLRVENDTQRKLGDLSVDCTLFGSHDQVRPDRSIWGFWCG